MGDLQLVDSNIWLTNISLGDYDVRAVLIRGEQRTLIWDTLSHPDDMCPFLPLLGEQKLLIVYSHADWDHIWGTAGLPYRHADIIAHTFCQARFATDVPRKLHEKQAAEPSRWATIELVAPTMTFLHELVIDLGSITVTLSHLPGHTSDSIVGFIPERGLLLIGDSVETPFPSVKHKSYVPNWIDELKRWEQDPRVRTVIPSHGVIGGREILRHNISYLQSLVDKRSVALPETLPEFYRLMHQMNLRIYHDRESGLV